GGRPRRRPEGQGARGRAPHRCASGPAGRRARARGRSGRARRGTARAGGDPMTGRQVEAPRGAPICGAKTRAGTPCRRPAGWGTANAGDGNGRHGVGRCKLDGGCVPVRHGRYSRIKREALRTMIAEYEADPDPLNLLPELAAARALFHDFVDRYEETTAALLAWHESFRAGAEDPDR